MKRAILATGMAIVLCAAGNRMVLAEPTAWGAVEIDFRQPVERATVADAKALKALFSRQGYDLKKTRESGRAPRIFVKQTPRGLAELPTDEKVEIFIATVLPNVLKANEIVSGDRAFLLSLKTKSAMEPSEEARFSELKKAYNLVDGDLDGLLQRVDVVPPSLALAQAIDESAWGTSRIALAGNALFGEHRPAGSTAATITAKGSGVKVLAFGSLLEGALAYLHNLNTTKAYGPLRARRAALRHGGKALQGRDLTAHLEDYSARGKAYGEALERMMSRHHLEALDKVRLCSGCGSLLVAR